MEVEGLIVRGGSVGTGRTGDPSDLSNALGSVHIGKKASESQNIME